MSASDRFEQLREQANGTASDASSQAPPVLTVVTIALSLLLVSPLVWLAIHASEMPTHRIVALVTGETAIGVTINTLVLVTAVTGVSILVGVPLAILTVQTDLPFRRFWTVTSALPLVVPSYIGAFAFVSAFGPRGELADLLAPFGVEQIPPIFGLHGTVLVLTLFTYPYVFLTTRASLLSFDGTVVEAARTLNHTRWEAFKRVTFPQIAPGIAAGALLVALYTLSDFGTPAIMQYDVFTRMIFTEQQARNLDSAAVLSILLLVMAMGILGVESRISAGRDGAYVSSGDRRPGTIRLGYWKLPATLFCAAIATLCLALPIGILTQWLLRSESTAPGQFTFGLTPILNSVGLAAAAAAICVVVALPIAYLAARGDSGLSSLPERISYVGYAVPGVVIGLSLIYLALRFVPFLYQSVIVLVFAYVVRFLPQAVGTTESSILQVDPSYIEAARSLGYAPLSAFREVVLPLVAPGIAAGAALVFLTTMKELPATLMLRPTGFETIVTYIWLVRGAAYQGQAAVPALILVGVSGLSMLVILRQERR
ncbi:MULTISPECIES: ABC transporter permease [Haloarcula]|uniref:Iron ABC transporter permease n=1 Tax=Haloarcula pellucida TaxID=1427151 RepID=A0A830GH61_9EURY|nr:MULTISPECIES: iron ABC transporter permease [Halomicroarcula]MBX0347492.1 iron ABC transporter permease [Halomicroarcula pellucida]MDS0276634.1 iron ABC transporter permease [Halomicroarcula sp. S1AR25-4]GGN88938.1 iron ABC transporter permease [Halomicroarcula pellucida]